MNYRIIQTKPRTFLQCYKVEREIDWPSRELDPITYKPVSYSKKWTMAVYQKYSAIFDTIQEAEQAVKRLQFIDAQIEAEKEFTPIVIKEFP